MEVDLNNKKPDIRYLNEMKNVVYDKEWLKTAPNIELYYMYRSIEEQNGIRYDITVIPARMLGQEFSKTKGHYHIGKYQEIYTVLEGKAIYVMQKKQEDSHIIDVYAIEAKKGDFVVIPSDYGHITINPSETEDLKMANWVSPECKSDYSLYEKHQGACWYYVKSATADGGANWIKNEKYASVPKLRFEEPSKSIPENIDFLKIG
ncbi:MAG: hypothetical protein A3A98_00710 [Candidatus Staskawiczbacteria bacterium RIFCSPLOWO2_01_FULL_40_39]|uniref:glucose-6-phosphate isomerase n=1 Tax=Candidatus Staskawiczbacteria bacterium RIFCSPHIGHO2_01_FULL_39_25 TaxID=1802202 RepID=A0A1G2HMT4_9BACT|nr:MAG: hypothetical protein A2730_00710 [Candidatus Staskawiczbacteria bacterium RIFCSPHIGHO2_01_FULL_39_25]OGZ73254.1 MAG: hypothetical protein A3A98_00710 [Candidatus Staskawiczbacteria bacterium RIFCSPLOWO2_01_FULL_40_39]